jgi:hypothetical protein
VQVADRYKRMGAVQLFCALAVASGLTFAQTRLTKKFADSKAFLRDSFQSFLCAGITGLHLLLDNGPTHAPKQLATWLASLELAFEVRLYWLPTYASWLDQAELSLAKFSAMSSHQVTLPVPWLWSGPDKRTLPTSITIPNPSSGPIPKLNCSPNSARPPRRNSLRNYCARYLGHKDLRMTARYAHVGQQHRLAAVAALERAYQLSAAEKQ